MRNFNKFTPEELQLALEFLVRLLANPNDASARIDLWLLLTWGPPEQGDDPVSSAKLD